MAATAIYSTMPMMSPIITLATSIVLAIMVISPWMNLTEIANYIHRSKRFAAKEIRAGRLRAARIGTKGSNGKPGTGGEYFSRAEWCDEYMTSQSTPIEVIRR